MGRLINTGKSCGSGFHMRNGKCVPDQSTSSDIRRFHQAHPGEEAPQFVYPGEYIDAEGRPIEEELQFRRPGTFTQADSTQLPGSGRSYSKGGEAVKEAKRSVSQPVRRNMANGGVAKAKPASRSGCCRGNSGRAAPRPAPRPASRPAPLSGGSRGGIIR